MESTLGLGDSSLFLTALPSYFPGYCHSQSSSESSASVFRLDSVQMGYGGPHALASSPGVLFWGLFSIRAQGIAACFGGVFSFAFSILTKVGVGTSFMLGGIGHDALATNKFFEAGTGFGHGVSSLVGEAVNVAVFVALGCCTTGGLP